MFSMRFYNETGCIDFGGGQSGSAWRITNADGLSFCGRTFEHIRYEGRVGQKTTGVSVNARTVTLSGDIFISEDFLKMYDKAMTVLEDEGVLEITTVLGARKIGARCCDFYCGEKKGNYLLFTVQFICDDPYFEDADKTEVALYTKTPFLNKNFTFPGMFSGRVSRKHIEYIGTRKTEPVFLIGVETGVDGDDLLIIQNHTTGEKLKFNYGGVRGEYITVDVKNCRIYNQNGENLLKHLADDSFFDGFHLVPGNNDIEVTNRNVNTGITVKCSYSNRYSEAVYI